MYCDWQPIHPHPTRPCKGGCKTEVDAKDGFCLRCRTAAQTPARIEPASERGAPVRKQA